MLTGKAFEATTMLLSFLIFCASYLLIVWKDRSWINWATPAYFFTLGGRYAFQFAYLCLEGSTASHYAFFFCYATYALSFLTGALVYVFIKPFKLKPSSRSNQDIGFSPWVLLFMGFLLYLPVLIQFRAYLSEPRRIYELTRSGYGGAFFGSTALTNLALLVFLFKKRKTQFEVFTFGTILALLVYWHGSKGLFVQCGMIWMLYRVYIQRKAIKAATSLILISSLGTLVLGSFFIFSSASDIVDLLTSVTSYADYVRNAMVIVDDEHGKRYYGKLVLEDAVYALVPRLLMPDKPKDFGTFGLAKTYNPENYRADGGTGAVDIGSQYADFGPLAILYLCLLSGSTGWIASTTVSYVRRTPTIGGFIILLYLSEVSVIPVILPFFLPETVLIAVVFSLALRFHVIRGGIGMRRPTLSGS